MNVEKPLFSIIIPVYDTPPYRLSEAVESVLSQSFQNFELIIINDGSNIEYKKIKNVIYIEHKINKGTLAARKTAITEAKGKYILYLDADDKLTNNALQTIYEAVKDKDYDIVHFSVKAVSGNTNKKEKIKEEKKISWYLSSKRSDINEYYLFNEVLNEKLPHNMCGKAFKSDLLKRTLNYLPDIHLISSEDMLQCLITAYFAKTYKAIYEELYICGCDLGFSNRDASSLSLNRFEKNCLDTRNSLNEFYEFLKKMKADYLYYNDYLKLCYNQYLFLLNKINNDNSYLDILSKYFGDDFLEEYKRFERIREYDLIPLRKLEEINEKLLPYFFSIIIEGFYIRIRLFGIKINIKTNKLYKDAIVITLSNLFRTLFSVSVNSKEIVLKFFGMKFNFKKDTGVLNDC